MQEIYVENLKELIRAKNKLVKALKVKITNKGKNIFIEGNAENEFITIEILKAVNTGFSIDTALLIKEDNANLQILNIKDLTKRHDLERVRARIIGTHGKTLKTLQNLTNCNFSLHNNQIGIIGDAKEIEDAIQSIKSLVQGSKQGNVYGRLERHRKEKRLDSKNINPN